MDIIKLGVKIRIILSYKHYTGLQKTADTLKITAHDKQNVLTSQKPLSLERM